jgi:hypothetical protein
VTEKDDEDRENDDEGRKWWQDPVVWSGITGVITATATLVAVLTGNGSGPA